MQTVVELSNRAAAHGGTDRCGLRESEAAGTFNGLSEGCFLGCFWRAAERSECLPIAGVSGSDSDEGDFSFSGEKAEASETGSSGLASFSFCRSGHVLRLCPSCLQWLHRTMMGCCVSGYLKLFQIGVKYSENNLMANKHAKLTWDMTTLSISTGLH